MTIMDAVRKQTELSQRVLAGTATDADRVELASLTEKLVGATQATGNANAVKAEMDLMNAAEFEKFLADEQAALAKAPDLDRLALLRENVEGVRKQVAKGRTVFAVRVPVIEKVDPIEAILLRLDEMEKRYEFNQRYNTGVGPKVVRQSTPVAPVAAPVVEAPAAPAVEQAKDALSKDAIDAFLTMSSVDELMSVIAALTAKAADEADDSDELRKLLDGTYDLAHLVTCAATIAQKAADLVEAAQALEKAKATRTAKPKAPPFPPAEEAPNGAPETDLDEDEESEDDMKGYGAGGKKKPAAAKTDEPASTEPEATEPEATDGVTKFAWSEDLSPTEANVGDRFRAFKRACSSRPT
jgi:hypothetical protein